MNYPKFRHHAVMRKLNRRQESRSHKSDLRPIPALFWTVLAATAVAVTAVVVITWLWAVASQANAGTDRASARLDAVRTGLAAGAGAGAAVGLVLAFRRQYHQEISTVLTDHDATERRITELYTQATEQLGNDKAPVRLAGLYALERLAQNNPMLRQTIINVVCAYLRMPFEAILQEEVEIPDEVRVSEGGAGRADAPDEPSGRLKVHSNSGTWMQEKQVRMTAQRIIAANLKFTSPRADDEDANVESAVTEELARKMQATDSCWPGISLDLAGATLIDFDLSGCLVGAADFDAARFHGTTQFFRTIFDGRASFLDAKIDEAYFSCTIFRGEALFSRAWFGGAYIAFDSALFKKSALFAEAKIDTESDFGGAQFLDGALFRYAHFAYDANLDKVSSTRFADFHGAIFSDDVDFEEINFRRSSNFEGVGFSRAVNFSKATLSGRVNFDGCRIAHKQPTGNIPTGWALRSDRKGAYKLVPAEGAKTATA
jgi:uncharacterized protein YjbI with pentapeptide repeats